MKGYKKVLQASDLPPGSGTTVKVGPTAVALFNVEGSFYAIDDTCVHAGGPLGAGALDGEVVTCPWHGWQFNVKKACAVMSEEITVKRYGTQVEEEAVYISVDPIGG